MTCAELNNYPSEGCDVDWAARNGAACNPWVDDCGPGRVCRHYVDIEPICVALPRNPKQAYEPCTPEAFDCDRGLWCNGEFCIPQCSCDPLYPHCEDAESICSGRLPADAVVGVCLPLCDVLDPVCPAVLPVCLPAYDGAHCVAVAPDYVVPLGEACDFVELACAPGTSCTERAPMCDSGMCCSPFCALDDPDACTDLGPDYACGQLSEYYDPLCYASVGVCRLM